MRIWDCVRRGRDERGFTLIELAIVLVIVGLLLAGFLAGLRVYMVQKKMDDTNAHIEEVRMALADFVKNENGPGVDPDETTNPTADPVRFPCPAGLTVAEGTAGYGLEVLGCRTMAAGADAGGISARAGAAAGGSNVVVIGAVPTATLGIPARYGYDAYGNRLIYAVTRDLTLNMALTAGGGTRPPGQIQILNVAGGGANQNVDFVVLSPGQGRQGAFTAAGVLHRLCNTGVADGVNCAWLPAASGGTSATATFQDSRAFSLATAGAGAAAYYDDRLEYSLGADEEDQWWGPTEPSTSADIFNQANTDNVVISGTQNRSQLIVNQTGDNAVEVAERGAGGPMILASGAEPSLALENRAGGAAATSRWSLLNPAGAAEDLFLRRTDAVGADLNVMTMDTNGNVGIGTTTPMASLQIGDRLTFSQNPGNPNVIWANNARVIDGGWMMGQNNWSYLLNGNAALISIGQIDPTSTGGDITFFTYPSGVSGNIIQSNTANVMTMRNNGNVGIGTTSPSHQLTIAQQAIRPAGSPIVLYNGPAVLNAPLGIVFARNQAIADSIDSRKNAATIGFAGLAGQFGTDVMPDDFAVTSSINHDLHLATRTDTDGNGWAEVSPTRLIVKNNGNVGIGTTTPRSILHLNGEAGQPNLGLFISKEMSNALPNDTVGIFFTNAGSPTTLPANQQYGYVMYMSGPNGYHGVAPKSFEIWEYPDATYNTNGLPLDCCRPRFRILESKTPLGGDGVHVHNQLILAGTGNVGVGTLTPAAKLDVAGEVRMSSTGMACNAAVAGAMRYNGATGSMEYCNGVTWKHLMAL